MLAWIGVCSAALMCFRGSLAGGHGDVVGYPKVFLFALAVLLVAVLIVEPIRRVERAAVWIFVGSLCLISSGTGFLYWYSESFIPILVDRGHAEPGKISFKKIAFFDNKMVVIKYRVSDRPDIECAGYLLPWRDAEQRYSDDYISGIMASHTESANEFRIGVDAATHLRISLVQDDMKFGYHGLGASMVCDSEDPVIDSSAFVERYLAKFGEPTNLRDYNYQFERLLDRVTQFPKSLEDPRLDDAVWTAFQSFENERPGKTRYTRGDENPVLSSARDLLWTYLYINAHKIRRDKNRKSAWIDRLLRSSEEPQQLIQHFTLLHLIAPTQTAAPELTVWGVDSNAEIPGGVEGLNWFSIETKTRWVTWGFNPEELSRPQVHRRSWKEGNSVDQDSWSTQRTLFTLVYTRPHTGQLFPRFHVRLPTKLTDDGIFFFPYEGQLHIWQNRDFYAGVLRMAQISGLIDAKQYVEYADNLALDRLEITARFDEQ